MITNSKKEFIRHKNGHRELMPPKGINRAPSHDAKITLLTMNHKQFILRLKMPILHKNKRKFNSEKEDYQQPWGAELMQVESSGQMWNFYPAQ